MKADEGPRIYEKVWQGGELVSLALSDADFEAARERLSGGGEMPLEDDSHAASLAAAAAAAAAHQAEISEARRIATSKEAVKVRDGVGGIASRMRVRHQRGE